MIEINSSWSGVECVLKPWGFEFELFSYENVSIWCLHIEKNLSTSLHCHPLKKTGYIVASGKVEIEFLSSKLVLTSGQKINFRPGLFHRTKALTDDVVLLEVETPKNKEDLIRLEDGSGRLNSSYETASMGLSEALGRRDLISRLLIIKSNKEYHIGNMHFELEKCSPQDFKIYPKDQENQIVIFLNQGLTLNHLNKKEGLVRIASPGDVVSIGNIKRMMPIIDISSNLFVMRGKPINE